MAGVDRINNQPVSVGNTARGGDSSRAARGKSRGADFERDLAVETTADRSAPVPARERDAAQAQPQPFDAEAARKRTLEELRTLVQVITSGVTDPEELTDMIFYARHPEMLGVPLTKDNQALLDEWNSISALLVHPTLNEVGNYIGANVSGGEVRGAQAMESAFARAAQTPTSMRMSGGTDRFDDIIVRAVEDCPGLSPAVLKGLLAQESNFNTQVINRYGYAGIAQFGREAAREVGLQVGVAGSASDERLDPSKAIPGAARLLNIKAKRLGELAFSRYGQPEGTEFWKFVLAAYNGGEATVSLAMGHAYRTGLEAARAQGLVGPQAVSFARRYASKWENLKAGGASSPLGLAAARYFPSLAAEKYREIGNYPTSIVARATQMRG